MSDAAGKVRALFGRQHGVLSRAQARRAGYTSDRIQSLLAAGRWQVLARGVYGLAGAPPTFERRAMAVTLAGGPKALISYWSACRLLGVGSRSKSGDLIHLSLPHSTRRQVAASMGAIVHRPLVLTNQDRVEVNSIPVTTPARTLVDMAGGLPGDDLGHLEDLVDDVMFRYRHLMAAAVLRTLDRVNPRKGGPSLRVTLGPWRAGPQPGSPPEIRLQRRLIEGGVGEPVRQFCITDPLDGSFIGRVDLAYPAARVAIEYQGERWHGPRRVAAHEQRLTSMIRAGWEPCLAYDEDTHPASCGPFVARIARLVADRKASA